MCIAPIIGLKNLVKIHYLSLCTRAKAGLATSVMFKVKTILMLCLCTYII